MADLLPYTSFVRWVFQALVINEFEGQTFTCDLPLQSMCELSGDEVLERLVSLISYVSLCCGLSMSSTLHHPYVSTF